MTDFHSHNCQQTTITKSSIPHQIVRFVFGYDLLISR